MIARITGTLLELDTDNNPSTVLLEVGDIGYEVMVPGYAVSDLSGQLGHSVTLYCLEYYEGSGTGSNLVPLVIGFPQPGDKAFFRKFISVKGIGIRKALRALAQPLADIAYCIEQGDNKTLLSLPEIGRRTAEQIIAELKGKVADFALAAAGRAQRAAKPFGEIETEALDILLQLGERRGDAEVLIERAAGSLGENKSTDAIIQAVYRLKNR